MKTFISTSLAAAALLGFAMKLHSQAPGEPKSPLQSLQALKAKNVEIIEKQTQTLQKLDDIDKEAGQLKAFGKRS